MKLLYCPRCNDMVRIQKYARRCECGESWGVYYSSADAVFGGRAIPIGVDNESLDKAIRKRPEGYGGKVSRCRMWVEGVRVASAGLDAFAYGHRASGAMNVDAIAADRAKLMKETKRKKIKSRPRKKRYATKKER